MKTTCGPLSAMFPKKYQAPLASLIVDQVHHTEVAQMLSDVAKNLAEKLIPKKRSIPCLGRGCAHILSVASRPPQDIAVFQTAVKDSRPRLADVAEYHKPRSNSFYLLFLYLPTLPRSNG